MSNTDGGAVRGTGGGKFGAAKRWTRPARAVAGSTVWTTTIMVDGIGAAKTGRRTAEPIDLLIGSADGTAWKVRCAR